MNTKQNSKIKLPRGWNKKIQGMAKCSATTVTKKIQEGDTDHDVWRAYKQLLGEALTKKKAKQHEVEEANKLREQLEVA
ncbi:hypothetical protein C8N40_11161 [Pontibacter mucosus]|uniref:Uncharacterized protein n=1 Tax=Pontibacter mucosus TaxID=1649266 RepID=A0A2T5YD07_9BACT|nr:hypothetical protein [Pontibacter mucosus]PTX14396.1 hypothetical protein C8N40_11161 [Pontibacter mucosus]